MKGIVLVLALGILMVGCNRGRKETRTMVFDSAEATVIYVKEANLSGSTFTPAISDRFTFAGRADTMGAGMALVVDAILAKGFFPDGFEQKNGYRLYRYNRTQ